MTIHTEARGGKSNKEYKEEGYNILAELLEKLEAELQSKFYLTGAWLSDFLDVTLIAFQKKYIFLALNIINFRNHETMGECNLNLC